MAADPIKFFAITGAQDTAAALVASFTQNTPAGAYIFTVTNTAQPCELHLLSIDPAASDPALPFLETDPSVGPITAQIAAGELNQPVLGGNWAFTDPVATQSSGQLPFTATGAAVQAAIRAGCGTNFANCLVTGNAGGPWTLDRGVTGAYANPVTGDTSQTLPQNSVLQIEQIQTGSTVYHDQWTLTLLQAPAVLANLAGSYLPAAAVATASVQAGDVGLSAIQSLIWNADAYAGSVSLSAALPTGGVIVSASATNPCVITTSQAHGLSSGETVVLSGNTQATVNSTFVVTVLSATTFSIPLSLGAAGAGGLVILTEPVGPIAFNAAPADIVAALAAHGSTQATPAAFAVTQNGPGNYQVNFTGPLGGMPIATIAATQNLKVPLGLSGVLNTNTAGVQQLMAGKTGDVAVDLELVIFQGGARRTVAFASNCLLRRSLIAIAAISANPLSSAVTVAPGTSVLQSPSSGQFIAANFAYAATTLGSGLTSKAVTFATPFPTGFPPKVVLATMAVPSGGGVIEVAVDKTTITETGFTAVWSVPTPDTTHVLMSLALP